MKPEIASDTIPVVSVIIPVRNGKPFLDAAIESVLVQNYSKFEIVLVNDGSTDDDYDRFRDVDSRIRVIHIPGSGVSRARNVGMENARGRYFAFLDADDVWFPGKLASQVRYLDQHPNVWVVFGAFTIWPADWMNQFAPAETLTKDCSELQDVAPEKSGWLYTRLLKGLLVGMNTGMIRREVYDSIGGFDESMRQGEDYDYWLKASRLSEMHSLAGAVALYRIHGSSAMHQLSELNNLALLLKAARVRWGLRNPDGSVISEREFHRRICQSNFDHGYAHFWRGSRKIAGRYFFLCLKGGYRPFRSLAYILRCIVAVFVI